MVVMRICVGEGISISLYIQLMVDQALRAGLANAASMPMRLDSSGTTPIQLLQVASLQLGPGE